MFPGLIVETLTSEYVTRIYGEAMLAYLALIYP
jgi:hypothetical protein